MSPASCPSLIYCPTLHVTSCSSQRTSLHFPPRPSYFLSPDSAGDSLLKLKFFGFFFPFSQASLWLNSFRRSEKVGIQTTQNYEHFHKEMEKNCTSHIPWPDIIKFHLKKLYHIEHIQCLLSKAPSFPLSMVSSWLLSAPVTSILQPFWPCSLHLSLLDSYSVTLVSFFKMETNMVLIQIFQGASFNLALHQQTQYYSRNWPLLESSSVPELGRSHGVGNVTHSSKLAWRTPWTEEPGGLQSMGSQRVGHN